MITGLLISFLVIVAVSTAIASGMVAAQRRRELTGNEAKALPAGSDGELLMRTIRDLRPGDVLAYDGRDYLIEGTVTYEEDGHRWSAGRLVDTDQVYWMVVGLERGGPLGVRMLAEDPDVDVSGYPPDVLSAGGIRYTLERRGTATATADGSTELALREPRGMAERCRWWLYEGAGDDTLLVEQWGDVYRALRGKKIEPTQVDLLPGS